MKTAAKVAYLVQGSMIKIIKRQKVVTAYSSSKRWFADRRIELFIVHAVVWAGNQILYIYIYIMAIGITF